MFLRYVRACVCTLFACIYRLLIRHASAIVVEAIDVFSIKYVAIRHMFSNFLKIILLLRMAQHQYSCIRVHYSCRQC